MATAALAQPAEYSLKISPADVQVIGSALGARPFTEVQALIAKLQSQIVEQNKPKSDSAPQ